MERLFLLLGYEIEIKWFRNRHSFEWNGINVSVDYTKGYGYILELEKMSDEESKDEALKELKEKLVELDIKLTPREEFDEKCEDYKLNWRELTGES